MRSSPSSSAAFAQELHRVVVPPPLRELGIGAHHPDAKGPRSARPTQLASAHQALVRLLPAILETQKQAFREKRLDQGLIVVARLRDPLAGEQEQLMDLALLLRASLWPA
jgi:hypothetical protein